jgi:endonuclease III
MENTSTPRTWTATVTIDRAVFEAPLSDSNLKASQAKTAIAYARKLIEDFGGNMAAVAILKTTKAHGTVTDRNITVSTDGSKWYAQ